MGRGGKSRKKSRQSQGTAELTDGLKKLSIETTSQHWNELSTLKVDTSDQRRSSVQLSVSEDDRRQSLFADIESQLTKVPSLISAGSQDGSDGRKVRPDEVFTDKARAAMVVIGTKDIKEALDKKKAEEIFRKTPEAKNAAVLYQQARFLMHQSRFKEALIFLNKAIQVDPKRKEWLTDRSQCYFRLLQPETALKFVNEVLQIDPKYFQALLLKGEILYSLWDLERSMLCFVAGKRLRPDNEDCIRGIHKVRMALEEISAFRKSSMNRNAKGKIKRSKSAKERISLDLAFLSPAGSSDVGGSGSLYPTPKCSTPTDRPSSKLSQQTEVDRSTIKRPVTAHARRRISLSSYKVNSNLESPKRNDKLLSARPKTAVKRYTAKPSDDTDSDSFEDSIFSTHRKNSDLSLKSKPSFRFSDSDNDEFYNLSERSHNDSKEIFKSEKQRKIRRQKNAQKVKCQPQNLRPKSSVAPRIAPSLGKDRAFLENILKDKGLKKANTMYTKRALRIARDLHKFVSEREIYWRNREHFIRYSKSEDDSFIF
nr:uncharacterized protein LOC107452806 [Parasteatoda tepidariorum]